MSRVYVIYHRADFDGLFCREIARRHFGEQAEYIGWDYGDPVPEIPADAPIVMLDISVEGLMDRPALVWIDHHKSAIAKYQQSIPGYRIDGVAACRLAWQWFFGSSLQGKEAFYNRQVDEPLAVRLAGEYDIWDKRDPRAELLQHGLRSVELTAPTWGLLLGPESEMTVGSLLENGKILQDARERESKSVITKQGFNLRFEGLLFLACNAARYNSLLFTAGLKPEHDGCLGFNWDGGKGKWKISLYGVPGKPEIDFSEIAVRYGGGGHKQACGFECLALPFALEACA